MVAIEISWEPTTEREEAAHLFTFSYPVHNETQGDVSHRPLNKYAVITFTVRVIRNLNRVTYILFCFLTDEVVGLNQPES